MEPRIKTLEVKLVCVQGILPAGNFVPQFEQAGPNADAFERYPPSTDSGDTPVLIHIKIRDKEATT